MSRADFDPRDRRDTRLTSAVVDGKWVRNARPLDPSETRIRYMARSGGYVMVRKPGCTPFVLSEKEWAALGMWEM